MTVYSSGILIFAGVLISDIRSHGEDCVTLNCYIAAGVGFVFLVLRGMVMDLEWTSLYGLLAVIFTTGIRMAFVPAFCYAFIFALYELLK
jgi:hypothetical protein